MVFLGVPTPIVKWAGGKRQLLEELASRVPEEFNTYHEFFFGGGALYFFLWSENRIKKAYINDSNPELINLYAVLKKSPYEIIEELKGNGFKNDAKSYYSVRAMRPSDPVLRAARFVYLNKTAFNGLYRVNSKGEFNVPFGRYKNPTICDEPNLTLVSEALKKAEILNTDFSKVLRYAHKRDFAYFDPPYHPLNGTAKFTSYTKDNFTLEDQTRLRDVFSELGTKGVYCMLSNSDTPVIRELYQTFRMSDVLARRMINCKADKRGPVSELIVANYQSGSYEVSPQLS